MSTLVVNYLSIESTLLSKSIIRSSDAMDSQGDRVSSDSVRESRDWRGLAWGAYELLLVGVRSCC